MSKSDGAEDLAVEAFLIEAMGICGRHDPNLALRIGAILGRAIPPASFTDAGSICDAFRMFEHLRREPADVVVDLETIDACLREIGLAAYPNPIVAKRKSPVPPVAFD